MKDKPMFQLVLDDINSTPKVMYKGQEVTGMIRVSFDWITNGDKIHPTFIHVEHHDTTSGGLNTKTIEHNKFFHESIQQLYPPGHQFS